jgi:hypothetical protein
VHPKTRSLSTSASARSTHTASRPSRVHGTVDGGQGRDGGLSDSQREKSVCTKGPRITHVQYIQYTDRRSLIRPGSGSRNLRCSGSCVVYYLIIEYMFCSHSTNHQEVLQKNISRLGCNIFSPSRSHHTPAATSIRGVRTLQPSLDDLTRIPW